MPDYILFDQIPKNPQIYTLEGMDGAGKTTQSRLIVDDLVSKGIDAVALPNPSKSPLGEFLRANMRKLDPWERMSIILIDLIATIRENSDKVMVFDRYVDSGYVSNRDITPEEGRHWLGVLPKPKKTFYLKIDPSVVVKDRAESLHDHSSDLDWQRLKAERYESLVEEEPERFVVIDANQPRDRIRDHIVPIILRNIF